MAVAQVLREQQLTAATAKPFRSLHLDPQFTVVAVAAELTTLVVLEPAEQVAVETVARAQLVVVAVVLAWLTRAAVVAVLDRIRAVVTAATTAVLV